METCKHQVILAHSYHLEVARVKTVSRFFNVSKFRYLLQAIKPLLNLTVRETQSKIFSAGIERTFSKRINKSVY